MKRLRGIANEQGYQNYRGLVEMDIKGWVPLSMGGAEWQQRLLDFSRWVSRYSRRRDAIDGAKDFGTPLLDQTAKEMLVARHLARDAEYPAIPSWDDMTLNIVQMSLTNLRHSSRLDVASLEQRCAFGPSVRRLWAEAKERCETDSEAWQSIIKWSLSRPPAWDRDDARKKLRQPLLEQAVAERMKQPVEWQRTEDWERPWFTEVDGETWQVRLNDFPDEPMYSLLAGDSELGDFHDWPEQWDRSGRKEQAVMDAAKPEPKTIPILVVPQGRFLERYLAGEHEAVWTELVSLGPAVREERHLAEARVVARETMRRARRNVELIIQRLDAMEYDFWDEERRAAQRWWRPRRTTRNHLKEPSVFRPPRRGERNALDRLESEGLVFPLSLRAWMEEVGTVDLCGSHPTLCFFEGFRDFPGVYADPLMVAPNADYVEQLMELGDDDNDLLISFDAPGKAGLAANMQVDGQYSMEVPNPAADGLLKGEPHGLHFVEYLRLAFRWGGFPGWEDQEQRPERELAVLTEGLLPF